MNAEQIKDEYQTNGRLSGQAMLALKALLRESQDPFSAITLAGDVGAFQLASEIAPHLISEDSMVRWNAAGVLFTRFRDVRFARVCLELLERESDTMVRAIALVGAGELLPLLDDTELKQLLAKKLLQVLETDEEYLEMRGAAYEGIEAAVGLSLLDRTPADRLLDLERDVKHHIVDKFRTMYKVMSPID